MTIRFGGRRPGGASLRSSGMRRRRTVRRATPRLSPLRAVAALVMLACVGAIYGLTATSAFAVRSVTLAVAGNPSPLTTEDEVRSELGLTASSPNLFLVDTEGLADRLRAMPAVLSAQVTAGLPGTLAVELVEREPILAWSTPGHRFLVDRDGTIVADAGPAEAADPTAAATADPASRLPLVEDRRSDAGSLAVGGRLDPVDFDVATRLGSLKPADVGSAANALAVAVDDTDGYTIWPVTGAGGDPGVASSSPNPGASAGTSPAARGATASAAASAAPSSKASGAATPKAGATSPAWTAVFGFYTPTIRQPDLIPGQVRVLRSLLAGRENKLARIILADDREGTYFLR